MTTVPCRWPTARTRSRHPAPPARRRSRRSDRRPRHGARERSARRATRRGSRPASAAAAWATAPLGQHVGRARSSASAATPIVDRQLERQVANVSGAVQCRRDEHRHAASPGPAQARVRRTVVASPSAGPSDTPAPTSDTRRRRVPTRACRPWRPPAAPPGRPRCRRRPMAVPGLADALLDRAADLDRRPAGAPAGRRRHLVRRKHVRLGHTARTADSRADQLVDDDVADVVSSRHQINERLPGQRRQIELRDGAACARLCSSS